MKSTNFSNQGGPNPRTIRFNVAFWSAFPTKKTFAWVGTLTLTEMSLTDETLQPLLFHMNNRAFAIYQIVLG